MPSLALYAGAILLGALAGGSLPLVGAMRRSDTLLSFSAGVMLGAAFFHMLPEAAEGAGAGTIPFVLVGFLFLFLLERYVLVHVCAEPGPDPALRADAPAHGAASRDPERAVADGGTLATARRADIGTGCDVHTIGLAAFVGLSLHTLVDGFALGAANADPALGLLVFLAILAHKIPSSFSLSAILRAEGYSRARALAMNAAFSLMVPAGAALYLLLRDLVRARSFTSLALAASAGTFLHLSLSDILPDLHRRGGHKGRLSIALLAGVAAMWVLRLVYHVH